MELDISKYTRVFYDICEEVLLYNTINRAIVTLPLKYFSGNGLNSDIIPENEILELKEMGFIDSYDYQEVIHNLYDSFNNFDKMMVSLETNLSCNLNCSYCYQISDTKKKSNYYK